MFENYQQPKDRNKAILAILINMATVDQQLADIEKQYLIDVANSLGLTDDDIREVLAAPDQYILQPPKAEHDRMLVLYHLLFTMRVDGQIKPREEELCYKAGLRLGFNHLLVSDLIRVMKKYLHEDIPDDAMINEVKKYLN